MPDPSIETVPDDLVEVVASDLYAGGPYGEFLCFLDDGARAITDAHTMDVYRGITRDVLSVLDAGWVRREELDVARFDASVAVTERDAAILSATMELRQHAERLAEALAELR